MFLFAVGYGVGPQFVRGIAKDGIPQALFAVVVAVFCLAAPVVAAKVAGYNIGSAAGLYAGSQTISASMGLATDAMNRLGLGADATKHQLDSMPIAYAVSYIFGTLGSAIILAQPDRREGCCESRTHSFRRSTCGVLSLGAHAPVSSADWMPVVTAHQRAS
jgi:putative transport protein